MFFDSKEIRSELMRIFSVDQLRPNQEIRRDMLMIEEKGGKCQYEEIEGEEPKNRWNIFSLRDQQILNTDIIINNISNINSRSRSSFLSNLFGLFFSSNKMMMSKDKEGGNNPSKQEAISNVMKMSYYFLFNKMSINSIGTYMALYTENINDHMILLVNLKTFKQFSIKSIQEILSFTWHPIEPCRFSYSTHSQTKHYSFSQDSETTLTELISIAHYNSSPIVKWLTAPNGQSSLLLTKSHLELYDITYKKIYEKTFAFKSFTNAIYAPNSSFFELHTSDEMFIFNSITLDFKSYSNFPGRINQVLISQSSNYIFALISKGNDILLYTIYNLSEDNYSLALYQSYNNTCLAYIHSTYRMHYNVYQLLVDIQQLERAELSSDDRRLALLYKSNMGERYLCLYDIAIGQSVHQFSIQPIILVQAFKGYSIKDFTMSYDYALKLNAIYFNWTDRFITKTMINVPNQFR